MIKTKLAIAAVKATAPVLRRFGKGGTTLPGRIALKLDPQILAKVSEGLHVTVVTGTNGKTTTSRMIEETFARSGYRCFSNKAGANVEWGITGMFVENASFTGSSKYTHAVIECDEGHLQLVGPNMPVDVLVVTNIFADQLDRFGTIENILGKIRSGVELMPEATLVLNADCSLTSSLGDDVPNKVVRFGVNTPVYKAPTDEVSDAPYCLKCKAEYDYGWRTFGHLGGWTCPTCGYGRVEPDVAVSEVLASGMESSTVMMSIFGTEHEVNICVPGGYNIYNAAAAAAAAHENGVLDSTIVESLADFQVGFGRAEEIQLGSTTLRMLLVKNTAGYNQVINLLASDDREVQLAFILNNRIADGTDVSWLEDVNFELLGAQAERFGTVYVTGMKADVLAQRLEKAGFAPENIEVLPDNEALLDKLEATEKPTYLMPSYTGMMESREAIAKRVNLKAIYE